MTEHNTSDLLNLAQSGDAAAGQLLLMRHCDRLRRMIGLYLDPRLSSRIDPSDVLQEALTCAARRLPQYLQARSIAFYPWLREIVRQALIDTHRRHVIAQRRSVAAEEPLGGVLTDASAIDLANQLVANQSSPSRHQATVELVARVKQAMEQLPDSERELVLMRFVEQLSIGEITEVLGITHTAAKSRIRRTLQKLARMVGDE